MTTQSGWQAQITRTGGSFVDSPTMALTAVRRFVPEATAVEAEDPQLGIWLIELTDEQVEVLQEDGWLRFTDEHFEINVEMP